MRNSFVRFINAAAIVVLLSEIDVNAQQEQSNAVFVDGRITNGFFVGVADEYGRTNSSPDRKLYFSIWTTNQVWTNNPARVVFPVEPEYAYQVELFDTNGLSVLKTDAGKKVGMKFSDFDTNSFFVPSTGHWTGTGVRSQRTIAQAKVPPYEMLTMFRPSDLFKIENPGLYTLRISFQIIAFPRTGPNRGNYTNLLIRFPPINYPIIQH